MSDDLKIAFVDFASRFGKRTYQWKVDLRDPAAQELERFIDETAVPTEQGPEMAWYLAEAEGHIRKIAPIGTMAMRFLGIRVVEGVDDDEVAAVHHEPTPLEDGSAPQE